MLLNRKKEKVNKKYTPVIDRRRQLSPGFLEDALEEVCCCNFLSFSSHYLVLLGFGNVFLFQGLNWFS